MSLESDFQRPSQPVQAEAEAEEGDAQSLSCEGMHDKKEEIERNAVGPSALLRSGPSSEPERCRSYRINLCFSEGSTKLNGIWDLFRQTVSSRYKGCCESAMCIALFVQILCRSVNFHRSGQGLFLVS